VLFFKANFIKWIVQFLPFVTGPEVPSIPVNCKKSAGAAAGPSYKSEIPGFPSFYSQKATAFTQSMGLVRTLQISSTVYIWDLRIFFKKTSEIPPKNCTYSRFLMHGFNFICLKYKSASKRSIWILKKIRRKK
jgi:hypothetical protein